jgi:hypothetical protein
VVVACATTSRCALRAVCGAIDENNLPHSDFGVSSIALEKLVEEEWRRPELLHVVL